MKRILFTLAIAIIFSSCHKENNTPKPTAGFSFTRSTADEISIGTNDTVSVWSKATNAASIDWDLGDGQKASESRVVVSYPKAGVYTITFTAKASNGTAVTTTKKVTVRDRVMKNIVINNIFWNNTDAMYAEAGWPHTDKADIYIKIQLLAANQFPAGSFTPNAPVVYTSPVLTNIDKVTNMPLVINVSGKVALDRDLLLNRRYLISLIAKNNAGEYVLVNNWYSGSYQSIRADDIAKNKFVVSTGLFSTLDMNFDFE